MWDRETSSINISVKLSQTYFFFNGWNEAKENELYTEMLAKFAKLENQGQLSDSFELTFVTWIVVSNKTNGIHLAYQIVLFQNE